MYQVLVVDDNIDCADSLADVVEMLGYEVHRCYCSTDAYQCIEEAKPRIAFLDIGMPVMNGWELTKKIRAEPWGKSMVLVAVSGWGTAADVATSIDAGFDKHLRKPAEFSDLISLLQKEAKLVPA